MNGRAELVMLGGWGVSAAIFDRLATGLGWASSIRQIDLPGHDDADGSSPGANLEDWAGAMLEQASGTTWLGWSLGGMVAIRAALDHPQRVRRLVLLATGATYPCRDDWPWGMDALALERFKTAVNESPHNALRQFNGWQVAGSEHARETLGILNENAEMHPSARRGLVDGLAILRDADLRPELGRLDIPVLMVAGTEDRVVLAESVRRTAALMPNAVLHEIPGAGHAAFLSHQAQVLEAMREFIEQDRAA